MCTNRTERIDLRCSPTEIAALDFLALRWDTTRSAVIRSMIVGAAMAQLDRLDDAIETRFDDGLLDLPSIDDVLAGAP